MKYFFCVNMLMAFFMSVPVLGANVNYTYDELNRLTKVEYENGSSIEYTYDAAGNRLTKSEIVASIFGRVTDNDGSPIANICVNALDSPCGNLVVGGRTNGDGRYSLTLPEGTYFLSTDVSCGGTNPASFLINENWNGTGGAIDCMAADPVTVTGGQSANPIDFSLTKGGNISGVLFQSDGITPITGETDLGVTVFSSDPCENPIWAGWAPINSNNGSYISSAVPAGIYYLQTFSESTSYSNEWWAFPKSDISCSSAQSVTVFVGQTTSNKNFQLESEIDSDLDGLSDSIEYLACTDPHDADSDDDGILDGIEDVNHNSIVDNGETDPCNLDSDGDGIQDGTELGYTVSRLTPDTDTTIFISDSDSNTTTDPTDIDTDNDGLTDGEEDPNYNGKVDVANCEHNPTIRDSFLYDAFTDSTIDDSRWLKKEIVREIVNGKLHSSISGQVSQEGFLINQTPFSSPEMINAISAQVTYLGGTLEN